MTNINHLINQKKQNLFNTGTHEVTIAFIMFSNVYKEFFKSSAPMYLIGGVLFLFLIVLQNVSIKPRIGKYKKRNPKLTKKKAFSIVFWVALLTTAFLTIFIALYPKADEHIKQSKLFYGIAAAVVLSLISLYCIKVKLWPKRVLVYLPFVLSAFIFNDYYSKIMLLTCIVCFLTGVYQIIKFIKTNPVLKKEEYND